MSLALGAAFVAMPSGAGDGVLLAGYGNGLSISTTSLPQAVVGQPYSATISASGGTTPYTWAVTTGALPSGLSLDPATGTISGTPLAAGTAKFDVRVSDSTQPTALTAEEGFSIVVITNASTLTLLNKMQVQPCGHHACATAVITAQLLRADGSPIANQLIALNLTPTGSPKGSAKPFPPPAAQLTDSNGLASFSFAARTPQAVAVQATAPDPATGQTLTSNKATVTFSPPPNSRSAIGALVWNLGGNCSGTVVDSSSGLVVVTAAHCVIDAEAKGPGYWVFGPSYSFTRSYAPYGVWTVSNYVIDRNNYPGDEAYDYAFFVIDPDDNGHTVQQVAGGFAPDFSATPGRGFTQYAYPALAGPGGPPGLVTCEPKGGQTAFESSPDANGAASYNLSCDNNNAFIGSSSGGPLVGRHHVIAGVLQGPDSGLFFNGVVGAFLSPASLPLFNSANSAAAAQGPAAP